MVVILALIQLGPDQHIAEKDVKMKGDLELKIAA